MIPNYLHRHTKSVTLFKIIPRKDFVLNQKKSHLPIRFHLNNWLSLITLSTDKLSMIENILINIEQRYIQMAITNKTRRRTISPLQMSVIFLVWTHVDQVEYHGNNDDKRSK